MTLLEYGTRILVGMVLAIVSTAALVLALVGLVASPTEQAMAIAAGVALQFCLYLFSRDKKDRWLSWILLVVSVSATSAFMEFSWQKQKAEALRQQQSATADSYVAQQLKQQIDHINRQMDIRLNVSERDTSGQYRSRGISQLDSKVAMLTEERNQLLSRLQAVETVVAIIPTGTIDAVIGQAGWKIRLTLFFALSLLLDYCTIRCLSTRMPEIKKEETAEKKEEDSASTKDSKPKAVLAQSAFENIDSVKGNKFKQTGQTVHENITPSQALQISDAVQRVAQRVRSGEYGTQPIVRSIIVKEKVRHPVVKEAFDLLQTEGVLVKNGQRFKLMTVV